MEQKLPSVAPSGAHRPRRALAALMALLGLAALSCNVLTTQALAQDTSRNAPALAPAADDDELLSKGLAAEGRDDIPECASMSLYSQCVPTNRTNTHLPR
jgi:hypothetical protein